MGLIQSDFAQTAYTKSTILGIEIQYLNISKSKSGYGTKKPETRNHARFFYKLKKNENINTIHPKSNWTLIFNPIVKQT